MVGIPFAGYGDRPSEVGGYYWSSTTAADARWAYDLHLTTTSAEVPANGKLYQYSVRCVRAVMRKNRPTSSAC